VASQSRQASVIETPYFNPAGPPSEGWAPR
jgi:hypothetical protein